MARVVLGGRPATTMFLHIPKTAGVSVRSLVAERHPGLRCGFVYKPVDQLTDREIRRLRVAEVVYGHYSFGFHNQLGVDGRYVTFVREPVARVLSMFDQFSKVDDNPFYRRISDGETLADLIESGASEMLNNHMTRILAGPVDPAPSNDPAMLTAALRNVEDAFDAVGVVERMGESIVAVAEVLRWPDVPTPGYENRSSHAAREVDPALRRIIEDANRLDLELYQLMADRL